MTGRIQFRRTLERPAVHAPVFFVLYVAAGVASQGLNLPSGYSPWFPPAGIALAYLCLVGPAYAPVALAARLVMVAFNYPTAWVDEPVGVIARAVAITAVYALGAWVLRKEAYPRTGLDRLGRFVLVGVVGAPLAAALVVAGVSVVLLDGDLTASFDSARTVWIGDSIAVATIAPPVLLLLVRWQAEGRPARAGRRWLSVRAVVAAISCVAVPFAAVALARSQDSAVFLVLAVLPAAWVALRGLLLPSALAMLTVNVTLSVLAASSSTAARMNELQLIMVLVALAPMYAVFSSHSVRDTLLRLADSEQRYRTLADNTPVLIARLDREGALLGSNRPGWLGPDETAAQIVAPLLAEWDEHLAAFARTPSHEVHWEVPLAGAGPRWVHGTLTVERDHTGEPQAVVALISDLMGQRRAELDLERARWHDPLTDLVNRHRFRDLLGLFAERADGRRTAVVLIDVDHFSVLNSALGHDRADELLVDMAGRLQLVTGPEALVGRMGANSFAIAVPLAADAPRDELGARLVTLFRRQLATPYGELLLTVSAGVAIVAPGQPVRALDDAETALQLAKDGGDRCVVFVAGDHLAESDRSRRVALVHRAVSRGDLVVHYQPIVDLATGALVGAEALVRLRDGEGGLLAPAAFMNLVEQAQLDRTLEAHVVESVLSDLARWRATDGAPPLVVAMNVTARQVTGLDYARGILSACRRHGVPPDRLHVELTETTEIEPGESVVSGLQALRRAGVKVALDDFGVGYSSIQRLRQMPIDIVKIDREFVGDLDESDDGDPSIVELVVGLARAYDLEVIAEGVETELQRRRLLEIGCSRGQGFLFGRAVDADDFAGQWLDRVDGASAARP